MSGSKKILTKGNLKKYLLIGAAFLTLAASPKQMSAQNQQGKNIENFDPIRASASDKKVYETICNVFSLKFEKEVAQQKATSVMSKSSQFEDEQQRKTFITMVVEKTMGKEFNEIMQVSKAKVLNEVKEQQAKVKRDSIINSDGNLVINTKTEDKFGTSKQKKVVGKDYTIEETSFQKNFSVSKLTPEELKEYNLIKAKLSVANNLKSRHSINDSAEATVIYLSPDREKLLSLKTNGIVFRDVDAESFVAYNTKTGEGQIWASQEKMADIRKAVKKAGGLGAYVNVGNTKVDTKTKKTKETTNVLGSISLGRQKQ